MAANGTLTVDSQVVWTNNTGATVPSGAVVRIGNIIGIALVFALPGGLQQLLGLLLPKRTQGEAKPDATAVPEVVPHV